MQILAVRGALPEHRYAQKEITDAFAEVIATGPVDDRLLRRLHGNAGVEHRHLVQPLDAYGDAARLRALQRPLHRGRGAARVAGAARRPRRRRRRAATRSTW